MLSRIKNVIFCNSVWTFIVVWLSKRLGLSPLPSGAHSLLASALFLLLVFRTNSSVRHCIVPPSSHLLIQAQSCLYHAPPCLSLSPVLDWHALPLTMACFGHHVVCA